MRGFDTPRNGEEGVDLKSAFLRWKTAALISTTLTICAGAYVASLPSLYNPKVQIMLPLSAVEDFSERKNLNVAQADPLVVHSYAEIVENDSLCLSVIKSLSLQDKPDFQSKPSLLGTGLEWTKQKLGLSSRMEDELFSDDDRRRDRVLGMYKRMLTVKADNKSLILNINFEMEDPFLATEIVNAHAAAFIEGQVEYRRREAGTKNAWLKAEVDRSEEEARQAQLALQLHAPGPVTSTQNAAAISTTDLRFRQMQATSKQSVYDAMLSKYQAVVGESRYIGSDIRIISPALVPTKPAAPKRLLLIAVISVINIILGLLVALVLAMREAKHDIDAFVEEGDMNVVGRLNFPRKSLLGWRRRRSRRAYFWEQVRQIRSGLKESPEGSTVIAITSPAAKDGKSLLAAALAQSYAIGGARTVLLDLNLRNRSFYTPQVLDVGLGAYLSGQTSATKAAARVDPDIPLFLLTRTGRDNVDVDRLFGDKLRSLLDELRRNFDRVVVDTPALSIVSDGFFVAELADLVVMATTADKTKLDMVRRAIDQFRRRSITIAAFIMSDRQPPPASACDQLAHYTSGEQWREIWPRSQPKLRSGRSWRFAKRREDIKPSAAAAASKREIAIRAETPQKSQRRPRRQRSRGKPKTIEA